MDEKSEMNEKNMIEQEAAAMLDILGANALAVKKWDEIITTDTITYPLADFASLGAAFTEYVPAFASFAKMASTNGTLYEAVIPAGAHLAEAKDGSGLLGAAIRDGKGLVGQARFREVGQAAKAAGGASTFFMALAIMAINHSLKNIAENQKSILCFLEVDKQTQLKGDLITLSDIIEEYSLNWDNAQFLSNREMQVLDIKRSAEQNILFYREMIEKILGKQHFVRLDTSKTLNDVQSKFKYYQLALYLYSFSSFLDVMLLKNFDGAFLKNVSDKIRQYAQDYTAFFETSLKGIESVANTSVQSRALQGLSIAGKFVGKQISRIPDKDNKIKIDDKLSAGSEKLETMQQKSVEDTKEAFTVVKDSGISLFVEKIELIRVMYNAPMRVAFDKDNLYLNMGE